MSYDDTYRQTADYFGAEPSLLLKDWFRLIDSHRPVLDIGAGQGRNALFLAREGYRVEAIDLSPVGIDQIEKAVAREKLPLRAFCSGFEEYNPPDLPYSAILLFGVLQVLPRPGWDTLISKIDLWLASGGYVFIAAFSTADPVYERYQKEYSLVAGNSFEVGPGQYRSFLAEGEILDLFPRYRAVHHDERLGPMHTHGGREPHRHGEVLAVLKRS